MKLLIDFNSIYKRFFFTKFNIKKDQKIDSVNFDFNDFYYDILSSLNHYKYKFNIDRTDIILVFDKKVDNMFWRNSIYQQYRIKNYSEKTQYLNDKYNSIIDNIKNNLLNELYTIIEIDKIESMDIISVISNMIRTDKLILTHNKNIYQLISENCYIYNSIEDKVIKEYNNLDLLKRIIQGSTSDNIPNIFKDTQFSKDFLKYIKDNGIEDENVFNVEQLKIFNKLKSNFLENSNKKTIYKRIQYKLDKNIDNNLDEIFKIIKNDNLLKKHYIRNKLLLDLNMLPKKVTKEIEYNYLNRDIRSINKLDMFHINNNIKKMNLNINYYSII